MRIQSYYFCSAKPIDFNVGVSLDGNPIELAKLMIDRGKDNRLMIAK
jgi:hypothetical protein